jgi:histone-lysine N-methyltransferase SUV420H
MKLKREPELLTPSPAPKKVRKDPDVKQEEIEVALPPTESPASHQSTGSSRSQSEELSPAPSSNNEATTDATSVDEDTIVVQPILSAVISKLRSQVRQTRNSKISNSLEQAKAGATILIGKSTSIAHPVLQDDNTSILSELQSDLELNESSMSVTAKSSGIKRKREIEVSTPNQLPVLKRKRKLPPPKTDVDHAPPVRVPGDYVLTAALLAEPASSWIVCKICEAAFLQKDAYFTRSSCPRCERHSKLYGYMWPKTDKEGKDDTEERVLDHRTVHRFIHPAEERSSRKRERASMISRAETREVSVAIVEKKVEEARRNKRVKRVTT